MWGVCVNFATSVIDLPRLFTMCKKASVHVTLENINYETVGKRISVTDVTPN